MRNSIKILFPLAVCLALSLQGCSSLSALGPINQFLTSQKNPLVQTAVDAATVAVLAKQKNPAAEAAKVRTIALAIEADAASPTATVSSIEAALNAEIAKITPDPVEAAVFVSLSQQLQVILNSYISTQTSSPVVATTLVSIQGVAAAVAAAASAFAPTTSSLVGS